MEGASEEDVHEAETYKLFEGAIRDELEIYGGFLGLELSDEDLDTLAWAVASQVAYGFSVKWDPDWVEPGSRTSGERTGGRSLGAPFASRSARRCRTRLLPTPGIEAIGR